MRIRTILAVAAVAAFAAAGCGTSRVLRTGITTRSFWRRPLPWFTTRK